MFSSCFKKKKLASSLPQIPKEAFERRSLRHHWHRQGLGDRCHLLGGFWGLHLSAATGGVGGCKCSVFVCLLLLFVFFFRFCPVFLILFKGEANTVVAAIFGWGRVGRWSGRV